MKACSDSETIYILLLDHGNTLSEQLAHSAADLHLKEISEFLLSKCCTSVSRLINTEPSELLRRLSEPIASESVYCAGSGPGQVS